MPGARYRQCLGPACRVGWVREAASRGLLAVAFVLAGLCWPSTAGAAPTVANVTLTGTAAAPQVTITGSGFGTEPAPTNVASPGYTGDDYGNTLYFCDTSSNPRSFCAGQNNGLGNGADTIGLVIATYSGTQITYTLGSAYGSYYYPMSIFEAQPGDQFSVTVAGATCSGTIAYNGTPVPCSSSSSTTSTSTTSTPSATSTSTTTSTVSTSSGPFFVPVTTGTPTIAGTATPGHTLTEGHGQWINAPTAFTYQWMQCDAFGINCSPIPGATSQTYLVASGDLNHTLVVDETASNSLGASIPAASTPTAVVAQCPASSPAPSQPAVAITSGPPASAARAPATRRPRRGTKPAGFSTVFVRGQDEIATARGKGLTSAYYRFVLPASTPFPRAAPGINLAPVTVDSRARRILLQFTSQGCPVRVLTGTFPHTALAAAGHRGVRLNLLVRLTDLTTHRPAGTFTLHITRLKITGTRSGRRAVSARNGSGGSASVSLSTVLNVYAGVVKNVKLSGTLGDINDTLPAVEVGAASHALVGSTQPITTEYKGSASAGSATNPFSLELTDDRTEVKQVELTHPEFDCTSPVTSVVEGEKTVSITGAVANGSLAGFGTASATFVLTGETAGYVTLTVTGTVDAATAGAGVTFQSIAGFYTLTYFLSGNLFDVISPLEEIPTVIVCSDNGAFTVNAVATSS
jgi:hypothetical protein